jgi:transposase
MAFSARPLRPEALATLRRFAPSRTAPARTVERARIMWLASQGGKVPAIALELGLGPATVRTWLKRFKRQGLAGLRERSRPGRPAPSTLAHVSTGIATGLTDPRDLGRPGASWTLDRLQTSRPEVKGLPIQRSRIAELSLAEGWRWRQQETWFGARVDPACAAKRAASRPSSPRRHQAASSSVWVRWAPSARTASPGSR